MKPTGNNSFIQSSLDDLRYETGVKKNGGSGKQARDLDVDLDRDGFAFIQRIAQLTNTNVAASKNLTGSAAKGGDWKLEATTGEINTPLVFAPEVLASYEYVLNSFSTPNNIPVGTNPNGIASGDFNLDGKPDLAVANQGSDSVSILLGNGTGGFDPAPIATLTASSARSIAVGNFNNDNFPDLAVVGSGSGSALSIFLGNGTGGFGNPTPYPTGISPISVAVGKFNNDNFSDVAVVNASPGSTSGTVTILLANASGNGTLNFSTNLTAKSIPALMAVGDFNGDTFSDLAVPNSLSGGVSIFLSNGAGGFSAATNIAAGTNPNSIATGDFNGDSKVDLAVVNGGSKNVSILLGNGTGGFSAPTDFTVGTGAQSIATGDFNGDGKLDLAVRSSSGAAILLGNGAGSFSTASNFPAGTDPTSIVAGNFNADTVPDLALTNNGSNDVSVLLNTPSTVSFVQPKVGGTYNVNEGATDTVIDIPVTISNSSSFGDVVVPIVIDPSSTATQGADYTLSTTSLTFPANTTTLTQNISVTIKADNIVDSNEQIVLNFGKITGAVSSSSQAKVAILDRNSSYTIATNTPSIIEGNSGKTPATFTIARNGSTELWSTVDYTIAGTATNGSDYNNIGGTSGATAATGKITFAAGETSKTITLDVLGDGSIEPDETIAITLSNPVSPGGAPIITTATATMTIANDDTAGFTVAPTNITATEGGATGSYKIKLNSQPAAPVDISFTTDNQITPIGKITFDSTNWNVEKTVIATAIDDTVAQGTHTGTIAHTVTSTDASYSAKVIPDVTASITDNDSPGISIVQSAGSTNIAEGGATATYGVLLTSAPTAPVTINFDAGTQISTIAPITFTPTNWNVEQKVTVSAIDDTIAQGTRSGTITHKSVSTDTLYNNLTISPVTATIADNDTAGVTISPTSTTATEGFATGTYSLKLTSQPTALVTIAFGTGDQISAIGSITFDSTNWNVAKPVTVTATDDAVVEGPHTGSISHTVTSADGKYNGIVIPGVTVAIADNDVAPPPIHNDPVPPTPTPTTVTPTPTPTTVTPTPTPTSVTPTPTPTSVTPTPTPTSVTPTPTPTPTPTSVTPTPTPTPTPTSVTPTPTPTPTPTSVTPTPTPTPTPTSVTPTPTPTPTSVTPTPTPTPTSVTPTPTPTATSVTPTPTPTPTTVTPTPTPTPTSVFRRISPTFGTGNETPLGNALPGANETPLADDNPGITVSPTSGLITTKTGSKAKFTVALNTPPTAPVTIGLNVSPQNPAEGTLSTSGVTFTPQNWNVPQEVTVTGAAGTLSIAANRPYTIVTAPAISTDSKYSGIDAADVSITNMFINPSAPKGPGILVEPTKGPITTEAGGTANFSVVLESQPKADVRIPVRSDNTTEGKTSVSELIFTPDNWNTAQTVTVTGVNDNVTDGDRPYNIILDPAISNDGPPPGSFSSTPRYSGIDPQDVSVTNLERKYTFSKITTEISSYFNGGAISGWGDYNNDGKLDFIASGRSQPVGTFGSSTDFVGSWLYRNTGTTFTAESGYPKLELADAAAWGDYDNDGKLNFALQVNPQIFQKFGSQQPPGFLKVYGPTAFNGDQISSPGSSQSWADYNNDGKQDLLNATQTSIVNPQTSGSAQDNASVLYRNKGNNGNDNNGALTPDINAQIPGVLNGSSAWGDYDKDGKLDLLLTGNSVSGKIAKVFRNTGTTFTEAFALPGVSNGSAAWGDYNNDGKLDILLAGDTGSGKIAKVFRNTGSGFSEDATAVLPGGSFAAWGDYDNDGKLDILLDGKVYRNTGNGFSEDTNAGLSDSGAAAWGDYNNDGKLDILIGNQVYRSNTANANTPPTAPTGLSAAPNGNKVTFNWSKATDAQTPTDGLSYNLRVGSTPGGKDILAPTSLDDGTRQIVGLGNTSQNTSWQLNNLSPGKYYWSVQSIDNAWAGSPFATEGSFTVDNTATNRSPRVNNPIIEQNRGIFRSDYRLTLAPNTFIDDDPGDSLTYSYSIIPEPKPDSGPLIPNSLDWLSVNPNTGNFIPPDWLKFDPNTLTFSVNVNAGNVPSLFYLPIKVTATDNAGATATDFFHIYRSGISGIAIDGYIAGSTLFLDANKNGIKDTNEPSTITNSNGEFNLDIPFDIFDKNKNGEIDPEEGNLVAIGGTDTATGLPLETPLTAPPDATVVTLLTSLIVDLIDKGIEPESAQSLVKASLGLPNEFDLTRLDPIAATNKSLPGGVQVLAAMVKVQNTITQTAALIDGASSAANHDIVKAVVSSIGDKIQAGAVLNLSNPAALEPIIQQSAAKIQQIDPSFNIQKVTQITSQSATVMATANQRIDAAVTNPTATSIPQAVARVQQVSLGTTTQDFKAVGAGSKPISQLVTDNTGAALDSKIQAVTLPQGIATPLVTGDADLGSNSPGQINGTNGNDILTGTTGNDAISGRRGNDLLDGNLGDDTLYGGKGSDTLLGASGNDVLFGGRGADILNGDDGNDILFGGKGDDLLNGGLGDDTLTGGKGVDKFLLATNSGTDTITDFEFGKDFLVLGNGLTFSQLAISQDSGATLIRFAQTGEILASLSGVSASSITAGSFGLI
ncbi:FG-GAP-like repeat-containing protein [Microcoleus sp. Aus8_D2]|uniref:FG-GAP-like repeat-containing protein n=1 Tax=Microcoleus sp. Aus8_D2 TaxID=2818632 RepID=UPI002FD2F5AE